MKSVFDPIMNQINGKGGEVIAIDRNNGACMEELEDEVNRLAKLSPLEYEQVREREAEYLGVRVSILDKEVSKRRNQSNTDPNAGSSLIFPNVEPWPHEVIGEELLRELIETIRRFVILPPHADIAAALWIMFTWTIDCFDNAPILNISSPEKQCGKSTLLKIIGKLVRRPLSCSNLTESTLFRSIEEFNPTLAIDEADTFFKMNEGLRGIVNSGHTRDNAFVLRTVGDQHEVRKFSTWGAKVIAGIGKLSETVHDRSIVLPLQRKRTNDKTEKTRNVDKSIFEVLARKLLRFAQDNADTLKATRPNLPENISDRAMDNWEPLLAIAELCGAEYAKKGFEAAQVLSGHGQGASSRGTELLIDIKKSFEKRGTETDKISSENLIIDLCKDQERPWATLNGGKAITPRHLGKYLKEYGIQSKTVRIGNDIFKGFERNQFEDAWERYISTSPVLPQLSATTLQSNKTANLSWSTDLHTSVTPLQSNQSANLRVVGDTKTPLQATLLKPNESAACDGVTDVTGNIRVEVI
jgi:putative DNA primase/helicase